MSSLTCYRKYDIVYYLLHSRLWPVTFDKNEIWGFQFSLNKNILKLTANSCGLYCSIIYANSMAEIQVIDHKLGISERSIPDHSFTI